LSSLLARVTLYKGRLLAGESSVSLAEDLEAFTEEHTEFVDRFA
jgi:hypothetical protein